MDKATIILNTAIQLFNEHGFHGTATSRIAKEAGVANGTLFQYFKTKEQLIVDAYIRIKETMSNDLAEQLEEFNDLKSCIEAQWILSLHWALDNSEAFDYLSQFHNSPYLQKIDSEQIAYYKKPHLEIIEQAIAQKLIQTRPVEFIYTIVSSHIYGLYQYVKESNLSEEKRRETLQEGVNLLWKMLI